MTRKKITDIVAILCAIAAIVTGFMLHDEVHHKFVYNDVLLWTVHEVIGIIMIVAVVTHCLQHSAWFRNFKTMFGKRKAVTSTMLLAFFVEAITGILLLVGSHSQFVSITHYVCGILFTLLAAIHVAKRFKKLLK